jgi:DMSO/TMAO reductase YedYZ molybdopterin-dependent catalytic subunit
VLVNELADGELHIGRQRRSPSKALSAVAGATAAVAALAVGEFVASAFSSNVTLVTSIGSAFIDRFAGSLKQLAVALFGTNDKLALIVGIVAVAIMIAGALGVASRRWLPAAPLGVVTAGCVGGLALATDPQGSTTLALAAGASSISAGLIAFFALWRLATDDTQERHESPPDPCSTKPRSNRRSFVTCAGAIVLGSGLAALAARRLGRGAAVDRERVGSALPVPTRSIALPAGATVDAPGVTPYLTPNSDFYRIDTALITPRVDAAGWSLSVMGLVDAPEVFTLDDLLAMDSIRAPVTLQCVSNEVGGRLIGNAVWQGVPLVDLLDRVGVQASAEQVVGRSVDGFTAGFPLDNALDGRTAIVAYAMNGEPLPVEHGFPARLVVAGLYGYVSATKWLSEIELTTWDGFDGYWVPRGWSKTGPVKTQSRIDRPSGDVERGTVMIAGVAWATGRGIRRVEVQVDDGPWQAAELGAVASDETWTTWRLAWDAAPGQHVLRVRATDGNGETQTADQRPPAPDGATGWHARTVTVA